MKEQHLFYAPEFRQNFRLPEDEAAHALRVLRMKEGDAIWTTDGKGTFFHGTITLAEAGKHAQCSIDVREEQAWQQPWAANIALAVAPTKNMDRMEWLAEKATEIGLNAFHFLDCANSERKVLKTERIEKIVVSAMKQSHKALKPAVHPLLRLRDFIALKAKSPSSSTSSAKRIPPWCWSAPKATSPLKRYGQPKPQVSEVFISAKAACAPKPLP